MVQHHEGNNPINEAVSSELLAALRKEKEASDRLISEMLHEAKPRFPAGKISDNDEGELAFALAADQKRNVVILRFVKAVDWIGLNKEAALHMAKMLNEKASQIE